MQRDAPGAGADVEHGPAGVRAASARQSVEVGVVGAALDVVPGDRGSSGVIAKDSRVDAAAREQLAQLEHRRVGRQGDRAARRRSASGRVERRARARARRRCGRVGTPAYFSRSASSAARVPAARHAAHARREHLEVGVPDPGDVAAVGGAVVEDAEQVELAGLERERAQDLVGAGRVLDEQERQLAAAEVSVSARPNAGATASRPGDDVVERGAERSASAAAAERVVDVVEAGERELDVDASPAACAA